MSIFKELAEGVAGDMQNWKEQVEELMARRELLRKRGELQFAKFREHQDDVEVGLRHMDDALRELEGGNNPPKDGEGTDGNSSENFREPGAESNGS